MAIEKVGANIMKNNLTKLKLAFHMLTQKDVMVGIPNDTKSREEGDELNNAEIGYLMEHGAPEANIPARPFMIPGVEACKDKVVAQLKLGAQLSMKNQNDAAEQALNRAGMVAQNSVRAAINEGIAPALAPSTLAERRRKGFKGTKPLIRTGQLRNSITYILRSK